jgi:hypothetical protein
MGITAVDPGGLPGFRDGLDASIAALLWIGGLFVLLAGLLPLIVPGALLAWLWLRFVRRQKNKVGHETTPPPWDGAEGSDEEVEASPEEAEAE